METLNLTKRSRNTLLKIAGKALEFLPMQGAPSDGGGPGRKMYFPIPLKNYPAATEDFIYVFAQSKLPFEPGEKDVGFTEDDIIDSEGVYLFTKHGDHPFGQVFPIESLFQVFTDLALQNRLIYRLSEMKRIVRIDEEFLDAANIDLASHSPHEVQKHSRLH